MRKEIRRVDPEREHDCQCKTSLRSVCYLLSVFIGFFFVIGLLVIFDHPNEHWSAGAWAGAIVGSIFLGFATAVTLKFAATGRL